MHSGQEILFPKLLVSTPHKKYHQPQGYQYTRFIYFRLDVDGSCPEGDNRNNVRSMLLHKTWPIDGIPCSEEGNHSCKNFGKENHQTAANIATIPLIPQMKPQNMKEFAYIDLCTK